MDFESKPRREFIVPYAVSSLGFYLDYLRALTISTEVPSLAVRMQLAVHSLDGPDLKKSSCGLRVAPYVVVHFENTEVSMIADFNKLVLLE